MAVSGVARPVIAVVAAAGKGTRLGADVPKAFVAVESASLLQRSVSTLVRAGVEDIVVVVSPEMEQLAAEQLSSAGVRVRLVHGGRERADSIYNGLRAIEAGAGDAIVLIHDAARAFTPPEMITRVVGAVRAGASAVVPVLPVADTIKVVDGDKVVSTPDRARLRAAQTPQGFDLRTLLEANEAYFALDPSERGFEATDDASLIQWHGVDVRTVDGDPLAFKITTQDDLRRAESLSR